MKSLNKYETVGIFLSIFVMIAVLGAIRLKAELGANAKDTGAEDAPVEVSEDEDLEDALMDALDPGGEIVKLVVDDIRIGSEGEEVAEGDTVVVHYMGETMGDVRFVDSYENGTPYTFTVGEGKVIEGLEKGVVGMKAGGERVIVVPHTMAYGNSKVGVIPARSALVFTVELLEIK